MKLNYCFKVNITKTKVIFTLSFFVAITAYLYYHHQDSTYLFISLLRQAMFRQFPFIHDWEIFDYNLAVYNRRDLGVGINKRKAVFMSYDIGVVFRAINEKFFIQFTHVDRNYDSFLNMKEFKELLKVMNIDHQIEWTSSLTTPTTNAQDEEIILNVQFSPLKLHTITKLLNGSGSSNTLYFESLKNWTEPVQQSISIHVSELLDLFCPQQWRDQPIGKAYQILENNRNDLEYNLFIDLKTINRFLPPRYARKEERIFQKLLQAFHPNAFVYTRFRPSGSAAILRAANDKQIDIAFRLHGEFQLNKPPAMPFWFTPSFFIGHLTLSRDLKTVYSFEMSIPTDRRLNVDLEWIQQSKWGAPSDIFNEVDIGQMGGMSLHYNSSNLQKSNIISSFLRPFDSNEWTEEIKMEEALKLVERELYSFKRIEYVPFDKAFEIAEREQKLVHSVILWGSLDDQAC